MAELDRITFVETRDGTAGAIAFCKQGMAVYRDALKRPTKEKPKGKYAREKHYRRSFVESLIAFRKYLIQYGEYHGRG